MNQSEKFLYHQIHPFKLLVDWTAAFVSLYLFWQHHLWTGLMILFVPSILVSFIFIRYIDLEKQKQSSLGQYVLAFMTKKLQFIRLMGMFMMVMAAWYHEIFFMIMGLIIVLMAWIWGQVFKVINYYMKK